MNITTQNQNNEEKLEELIRYHFKFLEDDYGFAFSREENWKYSFQTTKVDVSILIEHRINPVVEIQPINESASNLLKNNVLPNRYGVIAISMCLDPALKYKIEKISEKSAHVHIPIEIKKRADLLKRYCSNILKGDFSCWSQISLCLSKRGREFLDIL